MNNPLYGNFGSPSLYSNSDALYGSNFGSIYEGGLGGGLGMNNGFGMMAMPGYGYGAPSFGSGGLLDVLSGLVGLGSSMFGGGIGGLGVGLGMNNGFGMMAMPGYGYGAPMFGSGIGGGGLGGSGMLDVLAGLLGGLGSLSSSSNQGFGSEFDYDYGYESNYNDNNLDYTLQPNNDNLLGSNFDYSYGNELSSDLPLEDLRSFDSSMGGWEQPQYSFQNDYDFSQNPLDDFSNSLFQ